MSSRSNPMSWVTWSQFSQRPNEMTGSPAQARGAQVRNCPQGSREAPSPAGGREPAQPAGARGAPESHVSKRTAAGGLASGSPASKSSARPPAYPGSSIPGPRPRQGASKDKRLSKPGGELTTRTRGNRLPPWPPARPRSWEFRSQLCCWPAACHPPVERGVPMLAPSKGRILVLELGADETVTCPAFQTGNAGPRRLPGGTEPRDDYSVSCGPVNTKHRAARRRREHQSAGGPLWTPLTPAFPAGRGRGSL